MATNPESVILFFGVQLIQIFQMLFNKNIFFKKKKKKNHDTNRIEGLVYRYSPTMQCRPV